MVAHRPMLLCTLLLPTLAAADAEHWRLDPVHTQIAFAVDHLGFSAALGMLDIERGALEFDPENWQAGRVDVSIDLRSLRMGDTKWETTVGSWQFLNTAKWPTARFVGTRIERRDESRGVVHGALTLHGVTKPVDVEFTINKIGNDPYRFKRSAGFSARATLRRSDFGMNRLPSVVGDAVELRIEAQALRDRDAVVDPPTGAAPDEPNEPRDESDGAAQQR
jgi:polyisoprenoid-binding protein YceI